MAISRFETLREVDFDKMPIVNIDTKGLDALMGQYQNEYDAGRAKINEASFKNLSADAQRARELRDQQNQMIDDISTQYMQGVGQGRRAMAQGLTDLSRDYKEGGERYSINKNYETFMAAREELKKRVGKSEAQGGITADQFAAWQNYTIGNFGGTKEGDFGDWSTIDIDEVNKYVDGNMRAENIAKNWQPDKLKDGRWYKSNGQIYKKTVNGHEIVREEEIMEELVKALGRDQELTGFLRQYAKHTGREIDLNSIGNYVAKDKFKYNENNPLVAFAKTAAKKWSRVDKWHDEDINLTLEAQRLRFAREDAKEREEAMYYAAMTVDAKTKKVGTIKDYKRGKEASDGFQTRIDNLLKDIKKHESGEKRLAPSAYNEAKRLIANLKAKKYNLDIALEEAMDSVPEFKALNNAQEETLDGLGLTNNEHATALEAAAAALTKTEYVYDPATNMNRAKSVSASLTQNNIDQAARAYSDATGGRVSLEQARGLVARNQQIEDIRVKSEKAINTNLANNLSERTIQEVQIAVDQRDFWGTKSNGKPTAVNQVNHDLRNDPGVFTFSNEAGTIVSTGQDFYDQLSAQYSDYSFEFDKAIMSKYVPSVPYMQNADPLGTGAVANRKMIVSIPYTVDINGREEKRTMQVSAGFVDGVSSDLANRVEQEIIEKSSNPEAVNYLMLQKARREDPVEAFGRYEQQQQDNMFIPFAQQAGGDGMSYNKGMTVTRLSDPNPDIQDKHRVKIGSQYRDFDTYQEAEKFVSLYKHLSEEIAGIPKKEAKEYMEREYPNWSDTQINSFISAIK